MDELQAVLELMTDEERRELTEMMFAPKFNPLDYWRLPDPATVQALDQAAWMAAIEQRFKFLAADGFTVLRGETASLSYRDVLIRVCQHLKIDYAETWPVTDLEAEIFLALLDRAWQRLPRREQVVLTKNVQTSLAKLVPNEPLPAALLRDPVRLVLKGSSAIALSAVVRPLVLKHVAYQFALHVARYEAARAAIAAGGSLATVVQNRVVAQLARTGIAASAATYGATRVALSIAGPALWAWFVADLGWRAISTNYSRVIPAVFTFAQIRLTRGEAWSGLWLDEWGEEEFCYS